MSKLYGNVIAKAFNKEIDFNSDTIKVMLVSSTYTPDQDNHSVLTDVTGQVSGTGYTAGGAVLSNATVTYDGGTNQTKFDADDVVWPNSTITARYAVVYDDTPASDKPLIAYYDFVTDQSSVNGNFTVTWDANGLFRINVA